MTAAAPVARRTGLLARAEGLYGLAGAAFEKEVRVAARRRRYYALRFAYPVLLTGVVALTWLSAYGSERVPVGGRAAHLAEAGQTVVAVLVGFQLAAIPLLAMATLSTAVNEEVRARTLGVLLASPLGRFRIVLGKLLGRLVPLGLLVACSVPVLMVVRVFGGVPWGFVIAGTCLTLTTAALVGSMSLVFSSFFGRGYVALMATPVAAFLVFYMLPVSSLWFLWSGAPVGFSMWAWNPAFAVFVVYAELLGPGSVPAPWWLWIAHCGLAVGMSCLLLRASSWQLGRLGRRLAAGGEVWRARRARRRGVVHREIAVLGRLVRRVTGSTILARELAVHYGPSRWVALVAAAGVLTVACVADALLIFEGRSVGAAAVPLATCPLFVAVALTVAFDAPAVIAREREGRTLTLLLASPLRRVSIVLTKACGVICRALPMWGILLTHVAVFALAGAAHPLLLVHMGFLLAGTVTFFTGTGLFLSTVCRRTATAVALNALLLVGLWLGGPVMMEVFHGGSRTQDLYLCGHPALQASIVASGAGDHRQRLRNYDSYEWPCPGFAGPAKTTWVVGVTAAVHGVVGLALAGAASLLLGKVRT